MSKKGEFAQEIDKLIKDVYSEVAVPFKPFTDQKTIPDWIFLQQQPHYQGDGLVDLLATIKVFSWLFYPNHDSSELKTSVFCKEDYNNKLIC